MKKYSCSLLILLLMLSIFLSITSENVLKNGDFVLLNDENFYLCSIDESNNEITVEDILKNPKNKTNLGYLNWFDFEDDNLYYLKTQTNKNQKTYLQTISKEDLSINSVELVNNYYSCYLYKEKLYTISSYVDGTAYIVLDVYSNDLELEYTSRFEYDALALLPGGLVVDDEKIYVFCGVVGGDANNTNKSTYLFEFDLKFNIIKKVNLNLNDSGYQSAVKIDNVVYLAKTMQGIDKNGLGIGSRYIDRYNLNTNEIEYNAIELPYTHPIRIKYDKHNNNLIVLHDRWGTGNNYYSIYDLESQNCYGVMLDNKLYGEEFIFQSQNENYYYFQSPERLGIFDINSNTMREYDLKLLNLNLSNGIFFKIGANI